MFLLQNKLFGTNAIYTREGKLVSQHFTPLVILEDTPGLPAGTHKCWAGCQNFLYLPYLASLAHSLTSLTFFSLVLFFLLLCTIFHPFLFLLGVAPRINLSMTDGRTDRLSLLLMMPTAWSLASHYCSELMFCFFSSLHVHFRCRPLIWYNIRTYEHFLLNSHGLLSELELNIILLCFYPFKRRPQAICPVHPSLALSVHFHFDLSVSFIYCSRYLDNDWEPTLKLSWSWVCFYQIEISAAVRA